MSGGVMFKKTICSVIMILLLSPSVFGYIVYDPTNYAQNMINTGLNHITAVKTALIALKEISMLSQQIQMVKNQITNLSNLNVLHWSNSKDALNGLNNALNQGQAITYSEGNIDDRFRKLYPGYTANIQGDYQAQDKELIQTNQDTMRGVMDHLHASMEQQQQESDNIGELKAQAQNVRGNVQALQLGNEIATEQVAQLQKIHQTEMAKTNAETAYYAMKTQQDAASKVSIEKVINNAQTTYPAYKENTKFGVIPSFGGGL